MRMRDRVVALETQAKGQSRGSISSNVSTRASSSSTEVPISCCSLGPNNSGP